MKIIKYFIPYVIIGSFSYLFAKDGLQYSSPFTFMALRFLIVFLIFYFILNGKIIINKDILLLSVFTFTSTTFWILGMIYVSPAESAILSYTMPLFSVPFTNLILKEKAGNLEILGISIGFLGVVIYSFPTILKGLEILGSILTIINAMFWALFTIYFRKLRNFRAIDINTSQFLIATIFFSLLSIFDFSVNFSLRFLVDLLYVSLLGAGALFYLWNSMVRMEKIAKVTVLTFAVPALTQVLDIVILGVYPSIYQIIGSIVMFIGILLSRLNEIIKVH
ncbi:MAG: DMT family transporter [Sulfolobaceae archaeon]